MRQGHLGGSVEHSEGKGGGECCGDSKVSMW
jgi:hypothetical protein